MQIVATPIPSGAALTLGDDATGDFIIDPPPLPVEKRQLQEEPLALADRTFATSRGNRSTAFSWTVARWHATPAAAEDFAWTHAASVPENVSLTITLDDGSTTVSFSSAVITEVALTELTGASTKTRYSIAGAIPA